MLAASNWSGHQTRLSIVNLPAPIPAPGGHPGHGRPGFLDPPACRDSEFLPHHGITFTITGTQKL